MDTKPLTPSVEKKHITEPQIVKLTTAFGAGIRKANPFSNEAQEIIENEWDLIKDDLITANEAVLRAHLDRKRNTITVKVEVKRGLTPQQVLDNTGRKQYTNSSAVASMPLIPGDDEIPEGNEAEGTFVWFKPRRGITDAEVEQERAKLGLVRDLEMQAKYNADHPEFADTHPNGDSWKGADGKWYFARFDRWLDERTVFVYRGGFDWFVDAWFGGRRK